MSVTAKDDIPTDDNVENLPNLSDKSTEKETPVTLTNKGGSGSHEDSNSNGNSSTDSTEFADKGSILPRSFIKKLVIIGLLLLAIVAVLVTAKTIYTSYKNRPPEPLNVETRLACRNLSCIEIEEPGENECTINEDCLISTENNSFFAYVKDNDEIWIADSDGRNKKNILTLIGDTEIFSTLYWKDADSLSYAICGTTKSKECVVKTLNLADQSTDPELTESSSQLIRKFTFSPDGKYFAYIGDTGGATHLRFKSGSINSSFNSFLSVPDETNTQSHIFFTPDSEYIIYSTLKKDVVVALGKSVVTSEEVVPMIYVYQINGVKVDEIKGASDAFLVSDKVIGYKKDDKIKYREIGNKNETTLTNFSSSYNPVLSPDKTKVAYWKNEGGFSNVLLGVYDSGLGIHRNILRGVILPTWIGDNAMLGVKADGCFGQECLLYEYQTRSLILVNINNSGNAAIIDQGKAITSVTYREME